MKLLRKYTKMELLYNLFPEIGTTRELEEVLGKTGISTENSLHANISYLKNPSRIPSGETIELSVKNGYVVRIG